MTTDYDPTAPLPLDWNQWRKVWATWLTSFEARYGVTRGCAGDPFPGRNLMSDEVLGTWTVGQTGDRRPVELSEVTFPDLANPGSTVRLVGVTIDGVGLAGTGTTVATLGELDTILADLVHGRQLP